MKWEDGFDIDAESRVYLARNSLRSALVRSYSQAARWDLAADARHHMERAGLYALLWLLEGDEE